MYEAWGIGLMSKILLKSDEITIAFRKWLVTLVTRGRLALTLTVIGTSATIAATINFDQRLESAVQQEIVLGDLKGAMEQYQSVIRESPSRATVARSLYRYARCLEKLERRTEAYNAYTRITKEYGDQREGVLSRSVLVSWDYSVSGPTNLKFEQGVPGKLPDAWFVPALPNDVDHWAQLRRTGCMNRDSCAVVVVPENEPVRAGSLMQSFKAAAYRGKAVRLTAWMRLERSTPEDRGQMWLSVDRADNKKGFFDDMSDCAVLTPEWTRREIRAQIDRDATFIKFGVMSVGRGRVWVDNVTFEVVP
jgi:hypothetical protein